MLQAVTEERIRVRYGETDQMGHAYYGSYLLWFEQARGAWCRDRGFTYRGLEEMGYRLPVVEAHVRYKGQVRYDDLIVVRIRLTEVRRSALRFDYEVVLPEEGRLVTEGYTVHLLVDESLRPVSVPEPLRELLFRDPNECERLA
ncbi:MAG: acyl-CoA thioesterase [Fimbriimonadales bacterium]|nr:acyl-CoA thioesterase [Fimbriimonadales bacterium]